MPRVGRKAASLTMKRGRWKEPGFVDAPDEEKLPCTILLSSRSTAIYKCESWRRATNVLLNAPPTPSVPILPKVEKSGKFPKRNKIRSLKFIRTKSGKQVSLPLYRAISHHRTTFVQKVYYSTVQYSYCLYSHHTFVATKQMRSNF